MAQGTQSILVVGGGMAGISAALEAAEFGHNVLLVERNPYLGGRVAQMYKYFPKLCPPSCGLEVNYKRIKSNPRIAVRTQAEVTAISGGPGNFAITLTLQPRFVNEKCTCCGACSEACTVEVEDAFNYNLCQTKAAHLPHPHAFPMRYVLDPKLVASDQAKAVEAACEYGAINLKDTVRTETHTVGAVVWATGWNAFDPTAVGYYKFGQAKNVITNVMLERLAAPDGPTGGKILRPSDGQPPKHVLFVQCAGSRDEHHLAYCSGVCCLASLKQATYVREQLPESKVTICYIDIRAPERLEEVYVKVQADAGVTFVKSKIADLVENPATGAVTVNGEDTLAGKRFRETADLVVLATGIVPQKPMAALGSDPYGFLLTRQAPGHLVAGCVVKPSEVSTTVQDGTAAALRAIHTTVAR